MTAEPGGTSPPGSSAKLLLDASPLAAPLLARVISMMLARADCPVDKLHDALVVCDALVASASTHAANGHATFAITTEPAGVEIQVGLLAAGGARALREAVNIPGIGDVLASTTDEVRIETDGGDGEALAVSLRFDPAAAPIDRVT